MVLLRLLLVSVIALLPLRCGNEYAGLPRASAVKAAKTYVVRVHYRGEVTLFYRNTGDTPAAVRKTKDENGDRWWFIRFDDNQALNTYCVNVRRGPSRVIISDTAC
jgi:hypothetical protein